MTKLVAKIGVAVMMLTVFTFVNLANLEAASRRCKITDPTGTPLNVRASPNGRIINKLRNGREVEILESGRDNRGRSWVYVGGYYKGNWRNWGWVFREFVSCW